jgi:short-subunit dehydrogenase
MIFFRKSESTPDQVRGRHFRDHARARSVLITGASSGIGCGLAASYAAPGVRLWLVGRNAERLADAAAQCTAHGATVTCEMLDVRDREKLAAWIRAIDEQSPLDVAIASAGLGGGRNFGRRLEDPERVRVIIGTNLTGTINTLDAVAERMLMRGRGQIAVLGSFSALRGLPYCPAYGASKAGVHAYAEALRAALARHGIRVSIIAPAFVDTAMNRDVTCPKPLLMSVEHAVRVIRRGLDRGAPLIAFPRVLYWGTLLGRMLPTRWTDRMLARIDVDVP